LLLGDTSTVVCWDGKKGGCCEMGVNEMNFHLDGERIMIPGVLVKVTDVWMLRNIVAMNLLETDSLSH